MMEAVIQRQWTTLRTTPTPKLFAAVLGCVPFNSLTVFHNLCHKNHKTADLLLEKTD